MKKIEKRGQISINVSWVIYCKLDDLLFLFRCLGIHGKVITANRACLKREATTENPKVYRAIMAWIRLGEPHFLTKNRSNNYSISSIWCLSFN